MTSLYDGGVSFSTLRGVPLLLSAPLGTRVVVRFRLDDGALSDALGELTARDDVAVVSPRIVVTGRSGEISIPLDRVTLAKPVPPPPARRAPRF
ncbi:hypothetical protein SAMN04489745_1363 [Arthrobacter woluwensis]|uniref:Histone acetyltransferase Rv0428c-like SH3 domain-containing protein n=1 Tax=Arthrobacter woluwensis TaxID=156980 RepID=A0A1H4MIN4_9MICC|nr:hypothetical protein SAMN04489745_1363 [Arthrobacter woluwensis]